MSTDLIRTDEAEEVEGTAIDGDSLQEEIASPIIIDITYFVDPQGGQGEGNDEGEEESDAENQEGENDSGKDVPYEPGENQDDDESQQDEESSVKTETNAEVHNDSDVFVQVRTKDRTLVGR